jgi:hypothetical protein
MTVERELSAWERREIKRLVKGLCANFDAEYGCLPLDCNCPMLHKWWTGGGCIYFRSSVLPVNKALEASLNNKGIKRCKVCGGGFVSNGRQAYCSEKCRIEGQKWATAARVRKHRRKVTE